MTTLTIPNAHKIIDDLQARGASKDLAEGIIDTIQKAKFEDDPATKEDINLLREDISLVRSEMAESKSTLIMWVVGVQIAATGLLVASRLFA